MVLALVLRMGLRRFALPFTLILGALAFVLAAVLVVLALVLPMGLRSFALPFALVLVVLSFVLASVFPRVMLALRRVVFPRVAVAPAGVLPGEVPR